MPPCTAATAQQRCHGNHGDRGNHDTRVAHVKFPTGPGTYRSAAQQLRCSTWQMIDVDTNMDPCWFHETRCSNVTRMKICAHPFCPYLIHPISNVSFGFCCRRCERSFFKQRGCIHGPYCEKHLFPAGLPTGSPERSPQTRRSSLPTLSAVADS